MFRYANKEPLFHVAKKQKLNVTHSYPRKYDTPVVNLAANKSMSRTMTKNKRRRRGRKGIIKKRIPRSLCPKSMLQLVKASNYITHTCTAGALALTPIQGNSVDDPFLAKGAGQPLGYDQWKALYRKATVVGSRVKVTVYNGSTTSVIYGITACPESQGTTALSDYEYYREFPGTKSRLLSPDVDHGYMSAKRKTKNMMSVSKIKDNDELALNLVTETAPTRQWYWHIWFQPTDQTTTTGYIEAVIDVEYVVLLHDNIIPSRSVET